MSPAIPSRLLLAIVAAHGCGDTVRIDGDGMRAQTDAYGTGLMIRMSLASPAFDGGEVWIDVPMELGPLAGEIDVRDLTSVFLWVQGEDWEISGEVEDRIGTLSRRGTRDERIAFRAELDMSGLVDDSEVDLHLVADVPRLIP